MEGAFGRHFGPWLADGFLVAVCLLVEQQVEDPQKDEGEPQEGSACASAR
jgi:hypothetical protein